MKLPLEAADAITRLGGPIRRERLTAKQATLLAVREFGPQAFAEASGGTRTIWLRRAELSSVSCLGTGPTWLAAFSRARLKATTPPQLERNHMPEFGIFNDEGCTENGMFSVQEAEARLVELGEEADGCHVAECCGEHPEEEREHCEICMGEEESSVQNEKEVL
jgi:hypothetical protein